MSRITVVGCLPQLGHLVPLLRLARLLGDAEMQVRCLVPRMTERHVREFGLDAEYLPISLPEGYDRHIPEAIRRSRSVLYAATESKLDRDRKLPLQRAVAEDFLALRDRVAGTRPDLIVSTAHYFLPVYRGLARDLGVPLVSHAAIGSQIGCQEDAVRRYGPPSSFAKTVRSRLLDWGRWAVPRVRRIFQHAEWAADRKEVERLERLISDFRGEGPLEQYSITTGCALLERRYLSHLVQPCRERTFLGPLDPRSGSPLPAPLANWLEASNDPVVLVSFGTLLRPNPNAILAVLAGLEATGVRALFVAYPEGLDHLGPRMSEERFRREPFVPQPDVLDHPRVRAFVTHAGYGGTQEALWAGTPMLCIPLLWDQFYNAGIVDALGAGVQLDARRLTRGSVARAIESLLAPAFQDRTRELSSELREAEGSGAVTNFVEHVLEGRARSRSRERTLRSASSAGRPHRRVDGLGPDHLEDG